MASIAKAFAVPKHDIGNGRTEEIRYNETGWPLTRVVEWPSSVPGHMDSFGQPYVPETDSGYKVERPTAPRYIEPELTPELQEYQRKLDEGDAIRRQKAQQFGLDPSAYPLNAEETKMKKAIDSFKSRKVPNPEYQAQLDRYNASRPNPREKDIDRNKAEEMQQLEKEKMASNNLKSLQKRQSKGYDVGDQLEKAQAKYDNVFGLIKE